MGLSKTTLGLMLLALFLFSACRPSNRTMTDEAVEAVFQRMALLDEDDVTVTRLDWIWASSLREDE